ncbi:hypothetical protein H8K32_14825 [Undibacterium jejuense]|uniref:Secreted protein n=1 Tax=Undibacterium jejuense TaxID=1344949 RepID=A0A923HPL2_9BURK|nr:hypothetical protein [Undibacterium jejuense]MBC3863376.1 hypothetical protein [Undibacterium jejuense]
MISSFTLNTKNKIFINTLLFTMLSTLMCSSFAQQRRDNDIEQRGDPQRWYQEKNTPEAYFATLKKEAYAVYQESITDCKSVATMDKKQCTKDAKSQLQQDLADAKTTSDHPH